MLSRNFPKLKAWMGLGYSFLSRFIFTFICVHGCVSVYGCMQLSPVLTESGKECWVPGARVTSGWELPRECLDCTCVPCKSSKPSKTLSCLLSLLFSYIAFGTLTNVVVDKCEDKFFFFFFSFWGSYICWPSQRSGNAILCRQTEGRTMWPGPKVLSHILELPLGKAQRQRDLLTSWFEPSS